MCRSESVSPNLFSPPKIVPFWRPWQACPFGTKYWVWSARSTSRRTRSDINPIVFSKTKDIFKGSAAKKIQTLKNHKKKQEEEVSSMI